MTQIFISYSRSDKPFVEHFSRLLSRAYGRNSVWFDDELYGGSDWWASILTEIGNSDLFVYLLSDESLESRYCQDEFREAIRLRKPFLPIIVRRLGTTYPGNVPEELAALLRRTHYLDLSIGLTDPDVMADVYRAINNVVHNIPPQSPSPQENSLVALTRHIPSPRRNLNPSEFPFGLRNNQVVITKNFANTAGCEWQGVGGAIFDLNGQPLPGIRIHVFGNNMGRNTDQYTVSGVNPFYSEGSGWDLGLDSAVNTNTYYVELQSDTGDALSPSVPVIFTASCDANVAVVNFYQTKPLA